MNVIGTFTNFFLDVVYVAAVIVVASLIANLILFPLLLVSI